MHHVCHHLLERLALVDRRARSGERLREKIAWWQRNVMTMMMIMMMTMMKVLMMTTAIIGSKFLVFAHLGCKNVSVLERRRFLEMVSAEYMLFPHTATQLSSEHWKRWKQWKWGHELKEGLWLEEKLSDLSPKVCTNPLWPLKCCTLCCHLCSKASKENAQNHPNIRRLKQNLQRHILTPMPPPHQDAPWLIQRCALLHYNCMWAPPPLPWLAGWLARQNMQY